MTRPHTFRVLIGQEARRCLLEADCGPDAARLLLAASGGPRWLGLVGIDRALARFLRRRGPHTGRLPLLGASSGAWRVAAMACDDDGTTYNQLQEAYINQRYEGKPTPEQVSQVCRDYLQEIFTEDRLVHAQERSPFEANFTTTVFRKEHLSRWRMLAALSGLPVLNAVDRRLLGLVVRRALFSAQMQGKTSRLNRWDSLPTERIALHKGNFAQALLASGSIPFVLSGESAIPGAGRGHHVDGGLLDYHFEVETLCPVFYPHFNANPLPGWLDRFPPYRRLSRTARSKLCLILPSEQQQARYPDSQYPGRADFYRFSNDERIARWRKAVDANEDMERELTACLESGDLVRIAEPFP